MTDFQARLEQRQITCSAASASHSQQGWPAAAVIDEKPETGWAILNQTGQANVAVLEAADEIVVGESAGLTLSLHFDHGTHHTLGHFRLAATSAKRPVRVPGADGDQPPLAEILAFAIDERTAEQEDAVWGRFRQVAPDLEPQRKKLAELDQRREELRNSIPTTLISRAVEPRVTRVLHRGNWLDDSGQIVQPAVPSHLGRVDFGQRRASRLDLAGWLVQPDNPLVARVMVNRLWKLAFGSGIVGTPDDFGSQGQWPTHPKLLDWLAVEFVESGWDVKHMLRLIFNSATYRQSSFADGTSRQRDPTNRRLARQNRFRLPAEMVRDNALAVSGLLARKIGGPSVKPYQPAGYWAHLNFPTRTYQHDHGPQQYRRGLYTYWARTFLHPSLLAFDAPSREECTVQRPRSNTPLQSLVLLNDPTYVEAARVLAGRAMHESGETPHERIAFFFRQGVGRAPRDEETRVLADLFDRHLAAYREDANAAAKLLSSGEAPAAEGVDPTVLAAWTSVARVVLNLHEAITRY